MTPKYRSALNTYTMEVNESPEAAESMAQAFEDKFNSMSKYEQLSMSLLFEHNDFDAAFAMIRL